LKKIREINPEQAAIIITGYSETMNAEIADKLDIGFVQKPVNTNKLLSLMHRLIKQSGE